jgi:hopene-associated glycosyltransferase HpnB
MTATSHAHFVSTLIALLSAAIWGYLFFLRGWFWRLERFDDDASNIPLPANPPRIQIIIPARDEALTIGAAISALLKQDYPGAFSVAVVDDHSSDGTAETARAAAQRQATPSVTVYPAPPLEAAWTGKLWALEHGIRVTSLVSPASTEAPTFYWFTDADVEHAPDTLRRMVARAERDGRDLVSLMVLLHRRSFPEKLLIPPFLYFFLKLYPPLWTLDPNAGTAGAAGGCLLIRRERLERIGGLAAIRDAVIDDCSLAREVKRSGGRIFMGLTRASISLRDYHRFAEIRDLIARTAFTQLRYSTAALFFTITGLLLTYVAPVLLVFASHGWPRALGALAWFLMAVSFLGVSSYFRAPSVWSLTLPAAAAFYGYATVLSAARFWSGRGAQWKGRTPASSPTAANR